MTFALKIDMLGSTAVEIKERIGDDTIFIFGLTAEELAERCNNDCKSAVVIN